MTNTGIDIESLLEDEWYMVRHSGEIPEVALYSALHHLSEDPGGPGIILTPGQRARLLDGASQRYLEITLRDLLPQNMGTSAYRGIRRSYINWQRFLLFCERHQLDGAAYRHLVAARLTDVLTRERASADSENKSRMFNCSFEELTAFMQLLGLDPARFPALDNCCCTT